MKASKKRRKHLEKLINQITEINKLYEETKDDSLLNQKWQLEKEFRNNYIPFEEVSYSNDAFYTIPEKTEIALKIKPYGILDLFSGIGNLSYMFEAEKYYLVDIDNYALDIARTLNKHKNKEFIYENADIFEEAFTNKIKEIVEKHQIELITINPPFSKEFKKQTINFIKSLTGYITDIPIVLIIPSTWKIEETITKCYKAGTANFSGTNLATPTYLINQEPNIKIEKEFKNKEEEEEDINLYELWQKLNNGFKDLTRTLLADNEIIELAQDILKQSGKKMIIVDENEKTKKERKKKKHKKEKIRQPTLF